MSPSGPSAGQAAIFDRFHDVGSRQIGRALQIRDGPGNLEHPVKTRVENRLKTEAEQSWHQRRGDHKIDYIDLSDLLVIAQSKPNLFFPGVLGKENWFQSLVDQTSPSRHVLCHMNGLKENSVTALGVRLVELENHLKNRESEIRGAMTPTS